MAALFLIGTTFTYWTFFYAAKSSLPINSGIIASIFTTSVLFTCLLFWIIYEESLSKTTLIGLLLILISVGLISQKDDGEFAYNHCPYSLYYALFCAVAVGWCSSCVGLTLKWAIATLEMPPLQLGFDS